MNEGRAAGYGEAGYPYKADDGREELEREAARALRGGAWISIQGAVRCAYRSGLDPGICDDNVGFRVVFPGSLPAGS